MLCNTMLGSSTLIACWGCRSELVRFSRTIQQKFAHASARENKILPVPMTCAEDESPINRRRYQRYEIDTQLQVTLLGLEQRGTLRGRSLNISEAGIAGVFVTVWDVGTPVHLEFSVPVTSNPVRVGAVVRSRSGYRYGFEFVDLSPEQREIIDKTCRILALLER